VGARIECRRSLRPSLDALTLRRRTLLKLRLRSSPQNNNSHFFLKCSRPTLRSGALSAGEPHWKQQCYHKVTPKVTPNLQQIVTKIQQRFFKCTAKLPQNAAKVIANLQQREPAQRWSISNMNQGVHFAWNWVAAWGACFSSVLIWVHVGRDKEGNSINPRMNA
jgi:hypothetical protein